MVPSPRVCPSECFSPLSRRLLSDSSPLCSLGKITAPTQNHLLVPILTKGLYSLGLFAQVFETERIYLVTDQPMYWLSSCICD